VLAPLFAVLAAATPGVSDLSAPVASDRSGAVAYLRAETAGAVLFVVRDGRTTRIGTAARSGPAAQWSPDGRSLAYRDARSRLVVVGPSGRRVVEPLPSVASFAWSPQSDRVGYVLRRSGAEAELRVARVDGSKGRRITSDHDVLAVAWSADGRRLAYTAISTEAFSDVLEELRVVFSDGGSSLGFISLGSRQTTCCLAWSPTGAIMYAVADKVAGVARSPVPYVTTGPTRGDPGTRVLARGFPVAFSPQGRLLVQRGDRVVIVGAAGGQSASFAGTDPSWSPRGDAIVFHRGGRVLVALLDGTAPRVVAAGRDASWVGADALVFQRAGCGAGGGIYTVVLGAQPRRIAAARAC
jgi:dipeptidyl aminopeptidase/acylaminoacyl peptidase